jgi:hypothetical protein
MQKQERELLVQEEKQNMMKEDYRLLMQKQERGLLVQEEKHRVKIPKNLYQNWLCISKL